MTRPHGECEFNPWPMSAIVTTVLLGVAVIILIGYGGRASEDSDEFRVRLSVCEGKPAQSRFEREMAR